MTLKTDLISDLDIFFNSDEFAIKVTWNSTTFNCIFDNAFAEVQQGQTQVDSSEPMIMVKTSDVTGLAKGDTMTVSSTAYKVKSIQSDGTGVTNILLTRD